MKFLSRSIVFVILSLLLVMQGMALTDEAKRPGRNRLRMMAHILKKVDCPLSDDQIEQIKALERGPGFREKLNTILDTKQQEALKNAPKKRGGEAHPLRMMMHILKKAECQLSDEQVKQIKALERGPGFREKLHAALNDGQIKSLQDAPKRRHGRASPLRIMARILKKANCPLSKEQLKQLKDIKPGPDRREQVENILKPEQKKVLEDARGSKTDEMINKQTAVEETPEAFNTLEQNYPNPFNPATTIEYSLAKAGNVTVDIYGPSGQHVTTLVNEYQNAGTHSVVWNASSHAAGIYVCTITSGNFTESRKMTYLK